MAEIRVVVVDDEKPARRRILERLERHADLAAVGQAGGGAEAVELIRECRPDLVFLDVQMPELDGFGVLRALPDPLPVTIFVTAYDEYALRAFEVHALDYLLKPFSDERFDQALERAREQHRLRRGAALGHRMLALLDEARRAGALGEGATAEAEAEAEPETAADRPLERLAIKASGRLSFLRVGEIDWIEAVGNYVRLHVGARSYLIRMMISALEARLPADRFVRIHRSTIVNVERVAELEPLFRGEYAVFLRDGTRLKLSRTYRSHVESRLGQRLR